uniref:CRISPR type III-B/RAMP module-associated protein Cmr5 n=1 Tax=Dictyoglomus thermophilum TaxID=14 RepID=A0A7V3ZH69_DICTH
MNKETLISKLEKGRAEFAYKCVQENLINLKPFEFYSEKFLEDAIAVIKETITNKMKKDIEKNKITEKRIKELLNSPYEFSLKNKYQNLSDEEKRVIDFYKNLLKNYRSYIKKIPTMILSNGLGQTLAFIKAKSEKGNAYDLIYKQLTEYMKSPYTTRMKMPNDKKDLIDWVISCDSTDYRYITQEILAFLNWLKRFAEGLIEEEEE